MAYPVQPVEWLDVGNALKTGLDAGAQYQRSQLLREEDEQRKAAAQFIAPALQGDVGAMGRLIGGDPQAARNVTGAITQIDAQKKRTTEEQLQFANDTIASLDGAPEADRPRVYAERRAEAERRGWPVTMWPQQYSQPWHQIEKSRIIGVTNQWKAERDKELKQLPPGVATPTDPYTSVPNPPATPEQGASAAPAGQTSRGQVVNYLVSKHGMTPLQAQAVAGNLQQESGFRTNAVGDGGTAFGMGQWRLDRAQNLARFAHSQGASPTDPRVQLDFLVSEMRGGDMGAQRAWAMLQQARSPQEATAAMMHYFRPQGYTPNNPQGGHGFAQRVQYTQQAGAGGPAITEDWGTGQRVPGGVQQASYGAGGGTPMLGQEPPVAAPQGFQRASYEPPQVARAVRQNEPMRPENTVYNDGTGRAEPGGPVLGPQPVPDTVDPNIVQAQAQAPPQGVPATPQTIEELQKSIPPGWTLLRNKTTGMLAIDLQKGEVIAQGPGPDGRPIRRPFPIPRAKDANEPLGQQGAYGGTGEHAQWLNIVTNPKVPRDSQIYAQAHAFLASPRIDMTTGMQIKPDMSWADPPTYRRKDGTAPTGSTVESIPGVEPKVAEYQAKSAAFYDRMVEAEQEAQKFTNEALKPGGALARNIPFAGNYLQTPEFQQFDRARRAFINSLLRDEFGAAIGQDEYASAAKQYFPEPGDGPGVIADKAKARQTVIEGMKRRAGPALKAAPSTSSSRPASDADAEKERERLKQKYNLK